MDRAEIGRISLELESTRVVRGRQNWRMAMAPDLPAATLAIGCLALSAAFLVPAWSTTTPKTFEFASQALAMDRRRLSANADAPKSFEELWLALFSLPPSSSNRRSIDFMYIMGGLYGACALLLLAALLADRALRRRLPWALRSLPGALAVESELGRRRRETLEDASSGVERSSFLRFLRRFMRGYGQALLQHHLLLSTCARTIPTFSRSSRAVATILQLHLCILTAAMWVNVLEHTKPQGRYVMGDASTCDGTCEDTRHWIAISAIVMTPLFRFVILRRLRFACLLPHGHACSSPFPLHIQKFASKPIRSRGRSSSFQRKASAPTEPKSFFSPLVRYLWYSTQPFVDAKQFHSSFSSTAILFLAYFIILGAAAYCIMFTAFLPSDSLHHCFTWGAVMFALSVCIFEPVIIFWTTIVWPALVQFLAQFHQLGRRSICTRFQKLLIDYYAEYIANVQEEASTCIKHWWRVTLPIQKEWRAQVRAARFIQAVQRRFSCQRQYLWDRSWCMKVEVESCVNLQHVVLDRVMSPYVRLECDSGNSNVHLTEVMWDAGPNATFSDSCLFDVKDVSTFYLSVWSTGGLQADEFVGRGSVKLDVVKRRQKERGDIPVGVTLYDVQHGVTPAVDAKSRGIVNLRLSFIDPLREKTGPDGPEEFAWMLHRHKMRFVAIQTGCDQRLSVALAATRRSMNSDPGKQAAQAKLPLSNTVNVTSVLGLTSTTRKQFQVAALPGSVLDEVGTEG
eukprot:TRINITY_DN38567_c0_g1_i1.p1 TRINITY_DN38567_c0_g1~~TRINITY_DN38567_c0_g1_i1.p1  ORF type:complete len:739 (-),score=84.91 TRINITY_DN38567_c0_g1_i1:320-2536(-)